MSDYCCLNTPVGVIRLVSGAQGLTALSWIEDHCDDTKPSDSHLILGRQELLEYFSGRLQRFTVKVDFSLWQGFAAQVIKVLHAVPYGETVTYGEVARRAGNSQAARAVGRIMASNPLPIILPCHRVIAANGDLTGYSGAGGVATKNFLLHLEKTA